MEEKSLETKIIDGLIKQYSIALVEREKWRNNINSAILLISVTFLSIMISLHEPLSCSVYNRFSYLFAICLNSLCTLLLGLSLYNQINMSNKKVRSLAKSISERGRDYIRVGNKMYVGDEIDIPKIFVWFQKIGFSCFLAMIVFYTIYALTK